MLKRKLVYSLIPFFLLGLAGCEKRSAEQKSAQEQPPQQAAQPAAQPAPSPEAQQAQPQAAPPAAPAPALKQRPRQAERRQQEQAAPEQQAARSQEQARAQEPARQEAAKPTAEPVRATEIPAGAVLTVRLNEALDTDANAAGDTFTANLDQPVVVDGRVAIPKGTTFRGKVTTSEASGRLAGQGTLTVKLDSFELNGKTYQIDSTTASRVTQSRKKRDIGIIGGTAALGAAIGAIAGGGKGAAIGAGAGAAAGTAGAAATGKAHVQLPAETQMVFTLQSPISIR